VHRDALIATLEPVHTLDELERDPGLAKWMPWDLVNAKLAGAS
jgi:hypothetical protein